MPSTHLPTPIALASFRYSSRIKEIKNSGTAGKDIEEGGKEGRREGGKEEVILIRIISVGW